MKGTEKYDTKKGIDQRQTCKSWYGHPLYPEKIAVIEWI